jgi:hypothetical protein
LLLTCQYTAVTAEPSRALARVEMRVALPPSSTASADLRLTVDPGEVPLRTDMNIHGVHRLPVAWGGE